MIILVTQKTVLVAKRKDKLYLAMFTNRDEAHSLAEVKKTKRQEQWVLLTAQVSPDLLYLSVCAALGGQAEILAGYVIDATTPRERIVEMSPPTLEA